MDGVGWLFFLPNLHLKAGLNCCKTTFCVFCFSFFYYSFCTSKKQVWRLYKMIESSSLCCIQLRMLIFLSHWLKRSYCRQTRICKFRCHIHCRFVITLLRHNMLQKDWFPCDVFISWQMLFILNCACLKCYVCAISLWFSFWITLIFMWLTATYAREITSI